MILRYHMTTCHNNIQLQDIFLKMKQEEKNRKRKGGKEKEEDRGKIITVLKIGLEDIFQIYK